MKIEDISFSSLKYFIDAVEAQSLTRAAEMNFVTRPAVSLAMKRLEGWLGQSLLTHEKNSFQLTTHGENFYRHIKPLLSNFKTAMERPLLTEGTVKIGCSSSLMDHFLIPALKSVKISSGFTLSTGTAPALFRQFEEGTINMALVIGDQIKSPDAKILHQGHFVLCSKSGNIGQTVVTTEMRSEVIDFQKKLFASKFKGISLMQTESWSLCSKMAQELHFSCLVPDFLMGPMKPIREVKFKYPYQVSLFHKRFEFLSLNEIKLLEKLMSKHAPRNK